MVDLFRTLALLIVSLRIVSGKSPVEVMEHRPQLQASFQFGQLLRERSNNDCFAYLVNATLLGVVLALCSDFV